MNGYIEFSRKKYKFIPESKVWINRGTPVGEPADFYEVKPYNGRRGFEPLLRISAGKIERCYGYRFNYEEKRWEFKAVGELLEFLGRQGIEVSDECDNSFLIK